MLRVDGYDNVLQLLLVVFLTHHAKDVSGFGGPLFLDQPARAARNTEQHQQKEQRGDGGNSEFPSPFSGA